MLQPNQLFRLIVELAFVLLGLLLCQIAVVGRLIFDRSSPLWYGAAALVIWFGVRALLNTTRYVAKSEQRIRGGALLLLGMFMLAISWAPAGLTRTLVGGTGAILVARGLASAIFVYRAR